MKWIPRLTEPALLKILDLCATFFLDVSVLTLVFPILDTLVVHGQQSLTRRLFLYTLAVSGVFFLAAVAMTILRARKEATE
jgi:hypothetical protein